MNTVAAVVVTYNRLELLKQNIDKLLAQTCPCDILLVDNASTDGTGEAMRALEQTGKIQFHPRSPKVGKLYEGEATFNEMCSDIRSRRYQMICFNDSIDIEDFEGKKQQVSSAFHSIFPEKSSYESEIASRTL